MRRLARFCLCLAAVALCCLGCDAAGGTNPTREPLVPTLVQGRTTARAKLVPGADLPVVPTLPVASRGRERFGVGVPGAAGSVSDYEIGLLGIGWYLDWRVDRAPYCPEGVAFWQMIRVSETGYRPGDAAIRVAATANPGSVWVIGNEPDVRWQDNVTPERYADVYAELYHLIKSVDPTCQVAIGGISQPTPLRLAYLDRVLAAYRERHGEPMPVDVWNVHGFLLREERGSWGVDIPPGLDADQGALYEIDDHDDMDRFRQQILSFRRWMAQRGYRDRPLVVSEYGILMPPDYGFGVERVQAFMHATFDYFCSAMDAEVGYSKDGNRLVQRWAWYSLADTVYPTGNLFDPGTKSVTALGAAYAQYVPPDGGACP